jgi:hypothetical protein
MFVPNIGSIVQELVVDSGKDLWSHKNIDPHPKTEPDYQWRLDPACIPLGYEEHIWVE